MVSNIGFYTSAGHDRQVQAPRWRWCIGQHREGAGQCVNLIVLAPMWKVAQLF
jgi:hypothetical protein